MSGFQLSASNLGWQDEDNEEVYELMQDLGFTGLEIAPTRIFPQNPYSHLGTIGRWAADIREAYGFVIPSMQSIWYGQKGSIFEERESDALEDYTCQAFNFAAACGCKSLVFGCPRNRNIPEGHTAGEADGFFTRMGQEAAARGVKLALEANPPVYNTNFMNTTAEAAALVRRLHSEGLSLNLDMGTVLYNHEDVDGLAEFIPLVSHVHISRPGLAPVTPDPADRKLAELLRGAGYQGFVSLEMKASDVDTVEKSLNYLAEVFG